jgi:hypothetical protein
MMAAMMEMKEIKEMMAAKKKTNQKSNNSITNRKQKEAILF